MLEAERDRAILGEFEVQRWTFGRTEIHLIPGSVDPNSLRVEFDTEGDPIILARLKPEIGGRQLLHHVNLTERDMTDTTVTELMFSEGAEYIADPDAVWRVVVREDGSRDYGQMGNNRREVGIWRIIPDRKRIG